MSEALPKIPQISSDEEKMAELWENFRAKFFDVKQEPFNQFFSLMKDGKIDKICRDYFLSVGSKVEEIQPKQFDVFKKLISTLPNVSFLENKEHFKDLKVLYGLPGSGKTTRALSLQWEQNYSVLSTDSFLQFLRENSSGKPFDTPAANNDDFRQLELKTVFCLFLSGMLSDGKLVLDFGGAVMNQNLVRMLCYHLLSKENIELIEVDEERRRYQLLFDATNPKCHARSALLKGFNELKAKAKLCGETSGFKEARAQIREMLSECNKRGELLQKIGEKVKRLEKTSSSEEFKEPKPLETGVTSEFVECVKKYKEEFENFTKIKAEVDFTNGTPLIKIIENEKELYCKNIAKRNSLNFCCVQ